MSNPWGTAAEKLNQYVNLDAGLRQKLTSLTAEQSQETSLEFALEQGRIFGLRKMYYEMQLKRQLNRDMKNPPVEAHW